jgi:hypothetical protein
VQLQVQVQSLLAQQTPFSQLRHQMTSAPQMDSALNQQQQQQQLVVVVVVVHSTAIAAEAGPMQQVAQLSSMPSPAPRTS